MLPPLTKPLDLPVLTEPVVAEQAELSHDLLRLLYRQVRALAGPRTNLDDLVQAAAERVLRSLSRFEGRSAFSTWTYGIAYRTVLDHDRWSLRFRRRFSHAEEVGDRHSAEELDVEQSAIQAARAQRLHAALDRLPAAKRAVIVLHDLEELSLKETAAIVGANERTVRSRLIDGRRKLARLLADDPWFDVEDRRGRE